MQKNLAAAKYEISRAVKADLAAITRIYNTSVLEQNATATLHPVGIEEREAWFDAHEAANRPIYVLREVYEANLTNKDSKADCERKFDSDGENLGEQKPSVTNPKSEILAWGSLSDYHPREGYRITAEISVYVAPDARGKGLGGRLVNFMLKLAPKFGIKNVVALIFSSNAASLNLFAKFGFTRWGELPEVCDMGSKIESLTILGKKLG
ncbi:acetyltransferase [Campylobacter showae]|uniref:Acetyltransferase, GNAT family n=1 Tax=Campylobacter showae RM3277 TaxID=553219 RepID=C6RDN7_9BACT|nr:GNAT family N-acetyltransferase [Campylobacter showae]EET80434.1 acetyltransferase, GNAT family [Campylobacter showae RM3277]QCD49808.1 acetyltransferase [Campylobacter showae]